MTVETKKTKNQPLSKRMRGIICLLPLVVLGAPGGAGAVPCGDGDQGCELAMDANPLARVPTTFKFQARISQAKMPVPVGRFSKLYVNLIQGSERLCTEEFNNVLVKNSVLNLEIGRTMDCPLESFLAQRNGLAFQVCIEGMENCLKPVELGTVPYAVKATFASETNQARKADIAIQSHYAHRVTADRNLFMSKEIGKGYFDFHTPTSANWGEGLYGPEGNYVPFEKDGFVQWTPVNTGTPTLHVCAKDLATDKPSYLDYFTVHSRVSLFRGDVLVEGNGTVHQNLVVGADSAPATPVDPSVFAPDGDDLMVFGSGYVHNDLKVAGHQTVYQGLTTHQGADVFHGGDSHLSVDATGTTIRKGDSVLTVTSNGTSITGPLHYRQNNADVGLVWDDLGAGLYYSNESSMEITAGGTEITGDTEVFGTTTSSGALAVLSGGAQVIGNSGVEGELSVSDRLTVLSQGVGVTGDSSVTGTLEVSDRFTVAGNGAAITGDSSVDGALSTTGRLTVGSDGAGITGDTSVTGELTVTGELVVSGGALHAEAGADFMGDVEFGDAVAAIGTGGTVTFNADTAVQFLGPVQLTGEITPTLPEDSITAREIAEGAVGDAQVASSAAISTAKLSGPLTAVASHGLGSLATANSVNNGSWSGSDLAVVHGGTGASTASAARTNLGLGSIATESRINNGHWSGADLGVSHGGTGASNAAGARANLGLGGFATKSTTNNGDWSGTDLSVANGGTGASTASSARTNLGLGTFAVLDAGDNVAAGNLTVNGSVTALRGYSDIRVAPRASLFPLTAALNYPACNQENLFQLAVLAAGSVDSYGQLCVCNTTWNKVSHAAGEGGGFTVTRLGQFIDWSASNYEWTCTHLYVREEGSSMWSLNP